MIFLLLASILIQLGLSLGKCSHHVVICVTVCLLSDISKYRLYLVDARHKYLTVSIELFSNVFTEQYYDCHA